MKEYWDARFSEGIIWGDQPSETAEYAKQLFLMNNVKNVLIPGAGYGRNAQVFSAHFNVDAIEISGKAIRLAQEMDKNSHYMQGSVLDMPFTNTHYDGIYCYNLLHLFCKSDRNVLVHKCLDQLKENGFLFFTVFSDQDGDFGKGVEIEDNTFEVKPGKIAHFFSEADLISHFPGVTVLETGAIEEEFHYQSGEMKKYHLRYIHAKK